MSQYTYRILPSDEWDKLYGVEGLAHEFIPLPEAATAAIAEDEDGSIQGVLFLQIQLHMEPLLIRSSGVNFKTLANTLHAAVANQPGLCYFAFTDDPKVARMAELVGFEKLSYGVWKKEVV